MPTDENYCHGCGWWLPMAMSGYCRKCADRIRQNLAAHHPHDVY